MLIKTGHVIEFNIGDFVYAKMDREQAKRMVTAICLRPSLAVEYETTDGNTDLWYYGIELSTERDIVLATSN